MGKLRPFLALLRGRYFGSDLLQRVCQGYGDRLGDHVTGGGRKRIAARPFGRFADLFTYQTAPGLLALPRGGLRFSDTRFLLAHDRAAQVGVL